jgi:hypothetical protein
MSAGTLALAGISDPRALVASFVAAGRVTQPHPPEDMATIALRQKRRRLTAEYRARNPERARASSLKAVQKFREKQL